MLHPSMADERTAFHLEMYKTHHASPQSCNITSPKCYLLSSQNIKTMKHTKSEEKVGNQNKQIFSMENLSF